MLNILLKKTLLISSRFFIFKKKLKSIQMLLLQFLFHQMANSWLLQVKITQLKYGIAKMISSIFKK